MENSKLLPQVEQIFRELFDDPSLTLNRELTADDVEAWDSLSHVNLVSQIESEFDVRFALGEIQTLTNVGEMLDLLQEKLNE
jgi:acyl carrier protein